MTNTDEGSIRTINQTLELWIIPEIEKRHKQNKIELPYTLNKALVIFYPDNRNIEVLLNDEFSAQCKVKLIEGINKKINDPIYENEIEYFEEPELITKIDPNSGFMILLRIGDTWKLLYDLRYNKGHAKKFIEVGDQFLSIAEYSNENKLYHSFVDNLFSASELYIKAILTVMSGHQALEKARNHKPIKSMLNNFARLGNFEVDHRKTYNLLYELRPKARYCKSNFTIDNKTAKKFLDNVKGIQERAKACVYSKK